MKRILISASLATAAVLAQSAITNPSFESQVTATGSFTNAGVTGWSTNSGAGVWNIPHGNFFKCEAPTGTNVGYANGTAFAQQLTDTIQLGSNSISVMAARREDTLSASFKLQMWAGGTVASGSVTGGTLLRETTFTFTDIATSSFQYLRLNYDASIGDANIGRPITIRFSDRIGTQMVFDDARLNEPAGRMISGNIGLSDFVGNITDERCWVSLAGCNYGFKPAANGDFSVNVGTQSGAATIRLKGRTWLSKAFNVNLNSDVTGVNGTLFNGDCDNDNGVDLSDYTIIAIAFNALPASGNWNIKADLNGDQVVDLTDYTILAQNFNRLGE